MKYFFFWLDPPKERIHLFLQRRETDLCELGLHGQPSSMCSNPFMWWTVHPTINNKYLHKKTCGRACRLETAVFVRGGPMQLVIFRAQPFFYRVLQYKFYTIKGEAFWNHGLSELIAVQLIAATDCSNHCTGLLCSL